MGWFADEIEEQASELSLTPWKVLIVDDDDEVHKATKIALSDFTFQHKNIELISVYSGLEASEYLESHHDIAIVLLDVVMESEYAGLSAVKYIRENLNNTITRIILRTGQIKFAPINHVTQTYDIDGYLIKTETVKHVLHHQFYMALRSYSDLIQRKKYQKALTLVIKAMADTEQSNELITLCKAICVQLQSITCTSSLRLLVKLNDETKKNLIGADKLSYLLVDENGICAITQPLNQTSLLNTSSLGQCCEIAFEAQENQILLPYYIHYFNFDTEIQGAFILEYNEDVSLSNLDMIELFALHLFPQLKKLLSANNDIFARFLLEGANK